MKLKYITLNLLLSFFSIAGYAAPFQINQCTAGLCIEWNEHISKKPSVFHLKNPYRWVLDVPGIHQIPAQTLIKHCHHIQGCQSFRLGLHQHFSRFVLTTQQPLKVHETRVHKHLNQIYYRWALPRIAQKVKPSSSQILKRSRNIQIVIDPGHGGKDPGAMRGSIKEKNIVLGISKQLARYLNQDPLFEAHLTRTHDRYLTLRERLAVARQKRADCFIAIHADAFWNHSAHGVSVYALSERGASSEAARWLANQDNHSELMGGARLNQHSLSLSHLLMSLQQDATVSSSLRLGQSILKALSKITTLHHQSVGQAAFVVLKSPDILSLLIETGFVSHSREAAQLSQLKYQKHLAYQIYSGLKEHFKSFPPLGTRASQLQSGYWIQVKPGQTALQLAKLHHISLKQLYAMNPNSRKILRAGQKLHIMPH